MTDPKPSTREVIAAAVIITSRVLGETGGPLGLKELREHRDALQALLDGGLEAVMLPAVVRPNFEIEVDPDADEGFDAGADQMRERCAKAEPLDVPCTYCRQPKHVPCWHNGKPVNAHYTRWSAAILNLPLRAPEKKEPGTMPSPSP